ncbi:MAG: tRNA-dihydrouridine synthase family protein [Candidatus Micrarchaeota archaeon]|nr:tRNA-dihydrouridine synthase family protein [Candidatus Micrarchaeota archaeon]
MHIKNRAILAPLSDYTNAPFRKLCKMYGADYTIVPLVSAAAIARNPKYLERVDFNPGLDDCIQLFGADASDFVKAVRLLKSRFKELRWIDINCGCPSYKVCEPGAGSALLGTPQKAAAIIRQLRGQVETLSVKMRLAGTHEKTIAFAKAVAAEGIDFLTVHGRTPAQGYSGKADWERIRSLRSILDIPVIGNGDIQCRKDGEAKVREGYCDAFMIGRAAMGNPCCFSDLRMAGKESCKGMLEKYIAVCEEMGMCSTNDIRTKALQFLRGFDGSAKIRARISQCKNVSEIKEALKPGM